MSKFYTKPILLARFPYGNMDRFSKAYEHLEKKLGQDYHVLAVVERTADEFKIEVFNADEASEADLETLKEEIKESIKQLENKEE